MATGFGRQPSDPRLVAALVKEDKEVVLKAKGAVAEKVSQARFKRILQASVRVADRGRWFADEIMIGVIKPLLKEDGANDGNQKMADRLTAAGFKQGEDFKVEEDYLLISPKVQAWEEMQNEPF